jgi:hypothetical protein
MPFRATADDAELRALADFLSGEMARSLASSDRSATVYRPGDDGSSPNVQYRIEGDVRAGGEEVVVIARLIDGPTAKDLASTRRVIGRTMIAGERERLVQRLTHEIRNLLFQHRGTSGSVRAAAGERDRTGSSRSGARGGCSRRCARLARGTEATGRGDTDRSVASQRVDAPLGGGPQRVVL